MDQRRFGIRLAVILCLCFTAVATGHPFHTSTAEMEFNQQANCYEVTLKLLASDLDKVLALADQQQVPSKRVAGQADSIQSILDCPESNIRQRKAIEYVAARFYLMRGDKTSRLRFVGLEQDKATAWLYFELLPPEGDQAIVVTNKVFCDLNLGQINTVLLSSTVGKSSLKMDEKQPSQPLSECLVKDSQSEK